MKIRKFLFTITLSLSSILILGAFQTAQAAFLKDYEALSKTELLNEPMVVAMADTITGKGGGTFIYIPDDTRDEAWGLRIKSDVPGAIGSWVRQQTNSLNPDWFGAYNKRETKAALPPTFENLGYDFNTIRRRFMKYIPDISLEDTPDWAALQMLCRMQEIGFLTVALNPSDYFINRTVRLAEPVKPNDVVFYTIEGNGAWIYQINKKGFAFFRTMPVDQRQGLNIFTARRFNIRNLCIKGSAAPGEGSVGIAIGASFHSLLENIQLQTLDTGIIFRHAMSSEIYRCNAVNCFSVCYFIGSGKDAWPGANGPNSGSNQTKIRSSRMFTYLHQRAGVVIHSSSECRVEDFTLDGGQKKHTDYVVYINTGGVTTVKDGYVQGIHGEAAVDSAVVKFRGGGSCLFQLSDLFIQMPCNLVELEVIQGYSQVVCSNFSYFVPESTFANKGNGGAWEFHNVFERGKEPIWKTESGFTPPVKERIRNTKKL